MGARARLSGLSEELWGALLKDNVHRVSNTKDDWAKLGYVVNPGEKVFLISLSGVKVFSNLQVRPMTKEEQQEYSMYHAKFG